MQHVQALLLLHYDHVYLAGDAIPVDVPIAMHRLDALHLLMFAFVGMPCECIPRQMAWSMLCSSLLTIRGPHVINGYY